MPRWERPGSITDLRLRPCGRAGPEPPALPSTHGAIGRAAKVSVRVCALGDAGLLFMPHGVSILIPILQDVQEALRRLCSHPCWKESEVTRSMDAPI